MNTAQLFSLLTIFADLLLKHIPLSLKTALIQIVFGP